MTDDSFAYWLRLRRAAAGLAQRELAKRSGVNQPLISALENGDGAPSESVRRSLQTALQVRPSQLLTVARDRLLEAVRAMGGKDVRVFGSVAAGTDNPDSDLDLIITFPPGADIATLLELEDELARVLTVSVDIVSAGSSGAHACATQAAAA